MLLILSALLQIAPATSLPAPGDDLVRPVTRPMGGQGNVDVGQPAGAIRRRTLSGLTEAGERDSEEACRRQWFGRSMDYRKLVDADRDPCGRSGSR